MTDRHSAARLAKLRELMILESSPEQAYDDITKLLASTLSVPVVLVNLLDAEQDWFKSCVGLPFNSSPVATSFCETFFGSHESVIVVDDTTLDPRFQQHPLVIGPPHVRFYAAARLSVKGHTVGTLCAYDMQPRALSDQQWTDLRTAAEAVMVLLSARGASSR